MADPQGAKMRAESLSNKHVHEHQLTEAEQKVMEKFETLDYDVCENTLYREPKRNYIEGEERTRNLMYWCALSTDSAHSSPRSQRLLDAWPWPTRATS